MSDKEKKEFITTLIKRLEEIRDTAEIDEIEVRYNETLESFNMLDGRCFERKGAVITLVFNEFVENKKYLGDKENE